MNKEVKIIYFILMAVLGGIVGAVLKTKDIKIEKLTKENEQLQQKITEYKWQIEQVPYLIESWCKDE